MCCRLDSPQAKVEVVQLDLADLTSVKKTAASLLDEGNPVDVLVNNAGEDDFCFMNEMLHGIFIYELEVGCRCHGVPQNGNCRWL